MISNTVGTPIDRIKIGMPVSIFFEPAEEDIFPLKIRSDTGDMTDKSSD
jgi:hypothetical protein